MGSVSWITFDDVRFADEYAARRPRKFDLMDAHIVEVDPGGW